MGNILLGTLEIHKIIRSVFTGEKLLRFVVVFFLGIMLTAIVTWPFILSLPTYYSDGGDYPVNGSINIYNQESIRTGKILNQKEYFRGYQFYPLPSTLAYNDHAVALSAIFSPIYWLTSNIPLSVNGTNFLTFVLTFISSFYVINYLVKNYRASLIGASVFTFNPNILGHFPYHLNLMSRFFLFPVFIFFYKFIKAPSLKNAVLFGLFFTLNALSEAYYFAFTLVLLPLLSLPFIFYRVLKKDFYYLINLIKYGLILLIFLPLLLYFTQPYLEFVQNEGVTRTIDQNMAFSARMIDWFSPLKESLVYGPITLFLEKARDPDLLRGNTLYYELTLFPNILPILLFLLASRQFLKEKSISFYLWFLLILSAALTLGPYFLGWNSNTGQVPLPFYYLYENTPFLKGVRVPSRFQVIFYVPFSIFVSYGALFLFTKFKRFTPILFIFLLGLLILENINSKNYQDRSKVLEIFQNKETALSLQFLRGQPVLHFPINLPNYGKESAYINWSVNTGEILMNGNSSYLPADHAALLLSFKEKINNSALMKMSALGVGFIVIHKDLISREFWAIQPEFQEFSKQSTIFVDENIQILDLSKGKLSYKLCDFQKDLQINFTKANLKTFNNLIDVAIVRNLSDCYYPSISGNRYLKIPFYVNFIKHEAFLKMPPIISPNEQIILSSFSGDLRIE